MQDLQQRLKTEIQRENQNAKTSFKRIGYQMSQFPNVEAMGLAISTADEISDAQRVGAPIHQDYVSGKALERILESAPEVYGSNGLFGTEPDRDDKHIGKVVCIQTIKREPIKIEQTFSAKYGTDQMLIPRELTGKRFRVTFQEIESEGI